MANSRIMPQVPRMIWTPSAYDVKKMSVSVPRHDWRRTRKPRIYGLLAEHELIVDRLLVDRSVCLRIKAWEDTHALRH